MLAYHQFENNVKIIKKGDVLPIENENLLGNLDENSPKHSFGCVQYLRHQNNKIYAHIILMYTSFNTMVKEYGDPRELFFSKECCDMELNEEKKVVRLSFTHDKEYNQDKQTFFATKTFSYSMGRYENQPKMHHSLSCVLCDVPKKVMSIQLKKGENKIKSFYKDNCRYAIRDCVLIEPSSLKFKHEKPKPKKFYKQYNADKAKQQNKGGGLLYPEYYRKFGGNTTKPIYLPHQPSDLNEPFKVGRILEIKEFKDEIILVYVQLFYRVTDARAEKNETSDVHKLFLSGQKGWIAVDEILYKCHVKYLDKFEKPDNFDDLLQRKSYYFYFDQFFDENTGEIMDLHNKQIEIERENKTLFDKRQKNISKLSKQKLKTLELFAGCGGFSEGLVQSGVAELKWAVERDYTFASSYAKNNPCTRVFHRDCNEMLNEMIESKANKTEINNYYPRTGEVELLCGGPPCQGYSGFNRNPNGDNSENKKNMVQNFLSFVDFLNPHYVLFENVKNFVNANKNIHIKKTMASFLAMDFQCTFGVLQAGHYGLPQFRNRVIVMASKRERNLPVFPQPLHVFFNEKLGVKIDDKYYANNIQHKHSAPFIYTTVRDAIEDLLVVEHNTNNNRKKYSKNEALTSYQKLMRQGLNQVSLHFNENIDPVQLKRLELVPYEPGADWRDLPNEVYRLSDGSYSQYLYYDYVYDNPKEPGNLHLNEQYVNNGIEGELHQATCQCYCFNKFNDSKIIKSNKTKCLRHNNESQVKNKTIIPWFCTHTAYKNDNYNGAWGRVWYDGFLATLHCRANPKYGWLMHPNQNRVFTCREFARLQGFPDKYEWEGSAKQIYIQIGNAVPPPMAKAIGVEIRKAMAKEEDN